MEESFLSQLVSDPARGRARLALLLTSRKGLLRDVVVTDHVGYSDHEIIELLIFGETKRGINKTFTLYFWRADFSLFQMFIQKAPWEMWRIQTNLRNLCHKNSCPVVVTFSELNCSCSQHFYCAYVSSLNFSHKLGALFEATKILYYSFRTYLVAFPSQTNSSNMASFFCSFSFL